MKRFNKISLGLLGSGFTAQFYLYALIGASRALKAFNAHIMHEAAFKLRRNPGPWQRPFHQDSLGEPPAGHFVINADFAQLIQYIGLLPLSRAGLIRDGYRLLPRPVRLLVSPDRGDNRNTQPSDADNKNYPGNNAVV
jgi:hypothetical protein